ncbi:nitrogen fixation protein NifM [Oceanospirillum sediminis]|uniref:peptidylprolyl isomerase n=1 Tax=Oceanospirillum sediminis TaxID=2760088 RepID=A0A839INI7_9GAMM|nr:nitrogen fixation protein NifM [Oceanospirillum sediminis]MBB1486498.1 nitrogen fixation protein NifM [Oceanospirillum sediminis]
MLVNEKEALAYLELKIANARFAHAPGQLTAHQQREIKLIARRQFILEERVLASSEAQQIVLTDATLDEVFFRQREAYDSTQLFEQALSQQSLTKDGYRMALQRELIVDAVLETVAHRAKPVSEQEAREYYDRYPERFTLPEKRRTSHILITLKDDFSESEAQEVRELLNVIRVQVMEDPESFNELALRYSQCPTAVEGGQLGLVPQGILYDELDAVLFKMKIGDISAPVLSPMGYHLLWCKELIPTEKKTFAEARDVILQKMNIKRKEELKKDWIRQLSRVAVQDRSRKSEQE